MSEWIKLSEQLPACNTEVIAFRPRYYVSFLSLTNDPMIAEWQDPLPANTLYWKDRRLIGQYIEFDEITHWMPKPEWPMTGKEIDAHPEKDVE